MSNWYQAIKDYIAANIKSNNRRDITGQKMNTVLNGIVDAMKDDLAGKVGNTVAGNFASLDSNGDIMDSGHKHSEYATSQQGAKADTAYQKPSKGIPATDLASTVQNSLGKADTAVQSVRVGTTTTGNPDSDASVTNSGTSTSPVLDFSIPRGRDGYDAVNPFKGWFDSKDKFPANPKCGDFAYLNVTSGGTTTTYIYRCSTDGSWPNTSTEEKAPDDATFASAEAVSNVKIDDTGLADYRTSDDTNNPVLAKVSDVLQLKAKLQGITMQEVKAISFSVEEGMKFEDGSVSSGETTDAIAVISVTGADKIRFNGIKCKSSSASKDLCYGFFSSAETFDDSTRVWYRKFDSATNSGYKEYTVDVPEGSVVFVTTYKRSSWTNMVTNFYCYLQEGKPAIGYDKVADDYEGGDGKVLSAEKGKELHGLIYRREEVVQTPVPSKYFIQNTNPNTWTSYSKAQRAAYVEVSPGDEFRIEGYGGSMNSFYCFLQTWRTGSTVNWAEGYTTRLTVYPNSVITVTAPSDANYLYLQRLSTGGTKILPTVTKILPEENYFDNLDNRVKILEHSEREPLNKLSLSTYDGIKSMDAVRKCQGHSFIPMSQVTGTGGDFEQGSEYRGLPYWSTFYRNDSLFQFNLETIFSLWNNPDSLLYTYPDEHNGHAYTGAVCSSVACWFTGQPIWYPTQDIAKMLDRKFINDICDVEIGDVLVCNDVIRSGDMDHAMVVCDIFCDETGITAIEVFEAWKKTSRTYTFTPDDFMKLLRGGSVRGRSDLYWIGRLPNTKIRSIKPVVVNIDIISERGDNTYYELGEDLYVQSSQDSFTADSPSGESKIISFVEKEPKDGTMMRNIGDELDEIGLWTLHGAEGELSHITIIQKGTAVLGEDNVVSLADYRGCKPSGFYVVGIRRSGNGSWPSPVEGHDANRITRPYKNDDRYGGGLVVSGDSYSFTISILSGSKNVYMGYYVRVFYDTGCGLAWQDTNYLLFE